MKNIRNQPRLHLSLTLMELLSLWSMLQLGRMFTRPEDRKNVEAIFLRIGKGLTRLGLPRETIDKLAKLESGR